jgi:membrane protein DedA with SNARE-associated domain
MNDVGEPGLSARESYARRRRALVYAAPVVVVTVSGFIGTAFMPYLLSKAPLVLVLLSPIFRHLVLVSRSVEAAPLFAVAVPRHFAPDVFVYLLGREFGATALEWVEANSPGSGRFVRLLERMFAKAGFLVLLLSPDLVVSTLAGITRLSPVVFVVANIAGTIALVAVARYFGDVFDGPIRTLLAFFQTHLVVVTAASVCFVLLVNWYFRGSKKAA